MEFQVVFIYLFCSEINFAINIFMEISLSISLYSFLDWKSGTRIYSDIKCQNRSCLILTTHLILKKIFKEPFFNLTFCLYQSHVYTSICPLVFQNNSRQKTILVGPRVVIKRERTLCGLKDVISENGLLETHCNYDYQKSLIQSLEETILVSLQFSNKIIPNIT